MATDRMKRLLSGLSIASLIAGVGVTAPGPVLGSSGWGSSSGAGSAKEKAKSGWSGSTGAGGAPKKSAVQEAATSAKKKALKKNTKPAAEKGQETPATK